MIHDEVLKKSMLDNYNSPFIKYMTGEITLDECIGVQEGIKKAEKECKRIGIGHTMDTLRYGLRGYNADAVILDESSYKPPSVKGVVESKVMELRPDDDFVKSVKERDRRLINDIINFVNIPKEYLKESEKLMEDSKMWSMYDVIIVDKESKEILRNESVVAKNRDMALGKAGYHDILEGKDFDSTKLVVKVAHITDIKPVEDDEH
ncbi:MAG: hypothetical protein ACLFPF_07170 [Halanaerobiales bacterium]